jgi:hypothetical protein
MLQDNTSHGTGNAIGVERAAARWVLWFTIERPHESSTTSPRGQVGPTGLSAVTASQCRHPRRSTIGGAAQAKTGALPRRQRLKNRGYARIPCCAHLSR